MSSPDPKMSIIKPCSVILDPITPKVNVEFSSELRRTINERNMLTAKTRRRVTEALEEIESESAEGNRTIKKQKVLAEILESEENYIKQLEIIINFFIKPVKEQHLLDHNDFVTLFGDIEIIYKINKELLNELNKGPANVAKAFSKIAPFFKSYSFYAFEFKKSLDILQNCRKNNPKFAKFLENQESRPEVQSKLSALLIAPIQRVPRYRLLIKPLLDLSSPSEEDYESLNDSLSKIENAASHINKIIRERENMQRLIELQRCMKDNTTNIITPGRFLIKEGQLSKVTSKENHNNKKIHVVLTNDIIMFCRMKANTLKPNSLKCLAIFPLNKCKIVEILDKGSFRLICQEDEIVLYNKSLTVTREWIEDIKKAIDYYIEDRKTLRKESSARRPVKRNNLGEYNEIGISPGKRLKKKRVTYEEPDENRPKSIKGSVTSPFTLACRKPLRLSPPTSDSHLNGTCDYVSKTIFSTLKPSCTDNANVQGSTSNNSQIVASNDVFIFGQRNPDRGFTFKMNHWLCGIGSSVKKLFGFNNSK